MIKTDGWKLVGELPDGVLEGLKGKTIKEVEVASFDEDEGLIVRFENDYCLDLSPVSNKGMGYLLANLWREKND